MQEGTVGAEDGTEVWAEVEAEVGAEVWAEVGAEVGAEIGTEVGAEVGAKIGSEIGAEVGADVGAEVGTEVGAEGNTTLQAAADMFPCASAHVWRQGRGGGGGRRWEPGRICFVSGCLNQGQVGHMPGRACFSAWRIAVFGARLRWCMCGGCRQPRASAWPTAWRRSSGPPSLHRGARTPWACLAARAAAHL